MIRASVADPVIAGLQLLVGAALPPRCLACGDTIGATASLCAGCWSGLTFVSAPVCSCCGVPMETTPAPDARCGGCIAAAPGYDRARAALVYDDVSRRLLIDFKHADRTDLAPAFARWLARAGGELIAAADLLVPVPLHRWRLLQRRYNQAAMLSRALSQEARVSFAPDLLVRRRHTPTQGRLSASARRRNMQGAFAVSDRWRPRIAGCRILLVDDVLTTGATVESCARTLRQGGAAAVDVLTVARVVRPRRIEV